MLPNLECTPAAGTFLYTYKYNLDFGDFDLGDVLLGPKHRQNRGITVSAQGDAKTLNLTLSWTVTITEQMNCTHLTASYMQEGKNKSGEQ